MSRFTSVSRVGKSPGMVRGSSPAGERTFRAIAVTGGRPGETETDCPPCGICLQVMREFCDPGQFLILLASRKAPLAAFLPFGFSLDDSTGSV